jgi:hypothetical protein
MSMTNAAEANLLNLLFLNVDWANIGDTADYSSAFHDRTIKDVTWPSTSKQLQPVSVTSKLPR